MSQPAPTHPESLRSFVFNPALLSRLEANWAGNCYTEPTSGTVAAAGILNYLMTYHVYAMLLGQQEPLHKDRAERLALHIADSVSPEGLIREPDGRLCDHPANASHIVDGLGTFVHYGRRLGLDATALEQAEKALLRIVDWHPVVRYPGGVVGRTQQLRFELRAWYWAWRVSGQEKYRKACMELWENGVHAYRNVIADHGVLLQPSLHPDYTWNYACGAGTTTEYATNTHTPTYYCTEPQGFAFIYHHGLKDGVFERSERIGEFCRHFFLGLLRNLSRAGHTASDIDGYGVHRAWYAGCLIETSPVEAAGVGPSVGLSAEACGWFRWYVDRYVDFVRRSPVFAQTGLPEHQPYGHNITIEKQFPALLGVRFYLHLARAIYEYGLDEIAPVEPPAMASYGWWHNWLRVSTPVYETSFTGTTSLRDLPKVRHFGDPNLGCIHGGAPLSTLFCGNTLLYATSNAAEGLWHVELEGYNGTVHRSCMTSFKEETSMLVRDPAGELLSRDAFADYCEPLNMPLLGGTVESLWSRNERSAGIRFFVNNRYSADTVRMRWGASFPKGIYIRRAAYQLAIPAELEPQVRIDGEWHALADGWSAAQWPQAVRWQKDGAVAEVLLEPQAVNALAGAGGKNDLCGADKGHACTTGRASARAVARTEWNPGGENSFCPFAMLQLSLEVDVVAELGRFSMDATLRLGQGSRTV